jgi:hypothetical protein
MKATLVFNDWQRRGTSIYQTEDGLRLSTGDLHSGTTFRVEVTGLPADSEAELQDAARTAAHAVFLIVPLEGKPE